jgi:hypothetical protein
MAVQVDPIKPKLKPPGTERLKLNCGDALSNVAFKFNLRRYTVVRVGRAERSRGEERVPGGETEGCGCARPRCIDIAAPDLGWRFRIR